MSGRRFWLAIGWTCIAAALGDAQDGKVEHVEVYRVPGRFGGWPANHGMWAWGDELLVGFGAGHAKDNGPGFHAIDHDKPEEHLFARSKDGGRTWTIEDASSRGGPIPRGKALHGIAPPKLPQIEPIDCPGGVDFSHPDFAMTLRMANTNFGPSRFHYSYDRGRNWKGPYKLPQFNTPGVAARTDYIVNGPSDCLLFLTAGKTNGKEGRPFCARTTDGARSWKFVSWIGPEPKGFSIMPSTVRLGPMELFTTVRVHEGKRWIDAWRSGDDGVHWEYAGRPVADTGTGNPPSLIRLQDGRLCLTYGYRAKPFGMRAVLSSDGGKSWGKEIILRQDGGGTDVGYPRSVQRSDGKVVVVYYFHEQSLGDRYIAATIWQP